MSVCVCHVTALLQSDLVASVSGPLYSGVGFLQEPVFGIIETESLEVGCVELQTLLFVNIIIKHYY